MTFIRKVSALALSPRPTQSRCPVVRSLASLPACLGCVRVVDARAPTFEQASEPQPHHFSPNPPDHPWRHDGVWKRTRLTELGLAGQ